jgi:hypothetical protein
LSKFSRYAFCHAKAFIPAAFTAHAVSYTLHGGGVGAIVQGMK